MKMSRMLTLTNKLNRFSTQRKVSKKQWSGLKKERTVSFSNLRSTLKDFAANFVFQRAKSAETTSKSWNWPRKWQKKSMPERYFQNLMHYFVTNNTSGC